MLLVIPLRLYVMYCHADGGAPTRSSEHSPPICSAASSTCVSVHLPSTCRTSLSRDLASFLAVLASGHSTSARSPGDFGLAQLRRAFWRVDASLRSAFAMVF